MIKQDTVLLQNWLKTVVTAQGPLQHKISKAQRLHHFNENEIVSDEGKASIYARLNVYSSGYVLRLLECMSADFPVFKKFVGEDVFNSFAKAYLLYNPSTSFTLYDLGKFFPEYLEKTKPKDKLEEGLDNAYLDLPMALARLERARQEAMRASGTEEKHELYQEITSEDLLLQSITISLPECLQLLELAFPMKQFYEATNRNEECELPEPEKTYMAVSRKNYRVVMEELNEWQYVFLKECAEPVNLYNAVLTTAEICKISSNVLLADLYFWLPLVQSGGFVWLEKDFSS